MRPKSRLRWFCLTPDRVVLGLLLVWGVLLLSEQSQWLNKGYPVLLAVASVLVVVLFLLAWFAAALLFRWRFRFTVRSLFLLTVVVSIPCSWFAVKMQQATRQREAVEAIEKMHGGVSTSI